MSNHPILFAALVLYVLAGLLLTWPMTRELAHGWRQWCLYLAFGVVLGLPITVLSVTLAARALWIERRKREARARLVVL